jgi:hypothetical protein
MFIMNTLHKANARNRAMILNYLVLIILFLVLMTTGCVSVTNIDAVKPIVQIVENANKRPSASHYESTSETKPLMSMDLRASNTQSISNQLASAGYTKESAARKMLTAVATDKPVTLNNIEVTELAQSLLSGLHEQLFNGSIKTNEQWFVTATKLPDEAAADWAGLTWSEKALKEANAAAKARHQVGTNVFALFEAYYIAYANGQFVTRDGTVLGKPTANVSVTNGTFQGSLPNDTVDGIVTVFAEALNDCIFNTPLFYSGKTNTTYVVFTNAWLGTNLISYITPTTGEADDNECYVAISRPSFVTMAFTNVYVPCTNLQAYINNPEFGNSYVQLSRPSYATGNFTNVWMVTTNLSQYADVNNTIENSAGLALYRQSVTNQNDFFLNGSIPTASKFFPDYTIVAKQDSTENSPKKSPGLTQDEVQFIRAVSGLTSKQSEALGSLIFQSFGGASAGQFVFLHFSVGNSQILSSIVSTLLSSASYHTSEWSLTKVFLDYDGTDPAVNDMLKYYKTLLAMVTK